MPVDEGRLEITGRACRLLVGKRARALRTQAKSKAPVPVRCHSSSGSSSVEPDTVPAPIQYQCPSAAGRTSESGAPGVPPTMVPIVLASWRTKLLLTSSALVRERHRSRHPRPAHDPSLL